MLAREKLGNDNERQMKAAMGGGALFGECELKLLRSSTIADAAFGLHVGFANLVESQLTQSARRENDAFEQRISSYTLI